MNIKDYYKKSFNILKRNKKIILIIFVLYLVFLLGGTIYHNLTYEGFSSSEVRDAFFEDIKETILGDNFIDNFIEIFSNNIIASLFMIIGGVFLGIIPVFFLIEEAIDTGYSIIFSITNHGLLNFLWLFIPHNLFEIPAMVLSSAFGLAIFLSLFKTGRKIENLKNAVKDAVIIFIFWIIPLVFFAGIIESIIIMSYWF